MKMTMLKLLSWQTTELQQMSDDGRRAKWIFQSGGAVSGDRKDYDGPRCRWQDPKLLTDTCRWCVCVCACWLHQCESDKSISVSETTCLTSVAMNFTWSRRLRLGAASGSDRSFLLGGSIFCRPFPTHHVIGLMNKLAQRNKNCADKDASSFLLSVTAWHSHFSRKNKHNKWWEIISTKYDCVFIFFNNLNDLNEWIIYVNESL